MGASKIDLTFSHAWDAEILSERPLILPTRHFTYPQEVEEVERGALEVLVRPDSPRPAAGRPFLATCALGFRDPVVPSGIWSTPRPTELCAVAGGYTYLIDTTSPERFTMLPYRPVLEILAAPAAEVLLFVGHRSILAWGRDGQAWESPKLSDEGVTVSAVDGIFLRGLGWEMLTDKDKAFDLDLRTGQLS